MTRALTRLAPCAAALLALGFAASEALAFRMIQNTGVGRFSSGYLVTCNDPGGFVHWNNASISWWHNTRNQGSGKAAAIQNALQSWTNVTPATHTLTYAGTTTKGWATDGANTLLWARGNGCNGTCLALTALVLASGQVITETDVTFNDRVNWSTTGGNYDTEAVTAHEIGHTLGLHHTEVTGTPRPTMYASYFGVDGRSLEQDDKDGLNCAYNRYPPAPAAFARREIGSEPAAGTPAPALAARPRPGGALLRFALAAPAEVRLEVFDVAGRRLATLAEGPRAAGEHEVAWDGATAWGQAASGVYFARIRTPAGLARATVILAE